VDDRALAATRAQEPQQVFPHVPRRSRAAVASLALALLHRGDAQVRAEERALEAIGLLHPELPDDVAGHAPGRGRRERQDRDLAQLSLESRELPVRRPEVVPPVADA